MAGCYPENITENSSLDSDFESETGCRERKPLVEYVVRAHWADTYIVDVTIIVYCSSQRSRKDRFGVNSWNVNFKLQPGHQIKRFWNAAYHQHGDDVNGSVISVTHDKFSSPVRGKAMFYFGFEAQAPCSERPSFPSSMTVNSQVCEVDVYDARELADCAFDYVADNYSTPSSSREASPEPGLRRAKSAPPIIQIAPFRFLNSHTIDQGTDFSADHSASCLQTTSQAASEASTPLDEGNQSATCDEKSLSPVVVTDNEITRDSESASSLMCLTECVPQIQSTSCTDDENHHSLLGKRKVPDVDSIPARDFPHDCPTKKSRELITGATRTLKLDYYRRSEHLKNRKYRHMDWIDATFKSREKLVLNTVLNDASILLEPNMFPYDTPLGVSHWTLWSRKWLKDEEIEDFVSGWLRKNMPAAVEWNFDDNMSDGLSINLFHVHVYIRCPS